MRSFNVRRIALAIIASLALALGSIGPAEGADHQDRGAVFALTNDPAGNAVVVFRRAEDGTLAEDGSVPTGGLGAAGGLASQGALALGTDRRFLFAVNAGSGSLSVFRVGPTGVRLTDVVRSGGSRPISVTAHDDLVYVLNAGGGGNITGFRLSDRGNLEPLARSTRPLELTSASPFQVQFTPDGRRLVVTIKGGPNLISTYRLGPNGRPDDPVTRPSVGIDPTGFDFAQRRGEPFVLVAEAFVGPPRTGGVSSYHLEREGSLTPVDGSAVAGFNCWVSVTPSGEFAYSSSPDSNTISGHAIGRDGGLTLLNRSGVAAATPAGSKPTDLAQDRKGRFLYVLLSGTGAIRGYAIQPDGGLDRIPGRPDVPIGSAGLVAF